MTGMKSDEAKRAADGYFNMSDDEREEYDAKQSKFREFFEDDAFTGRGWDGDDDRDGRRNFNRDDDDESFGGIFSEI